MSLKIEVSTLLTNAAQNIQKRVMINGAANGKNKFAANHPKNSLIYILLPVISEI
jgi:hypothetical protein